MNIFEIEESLLEIFNKIEENEGEITPEIEEALEVTENNFVNKVKSYVDIIKVLKSDIDLIKCEQDRLSDLKKSKEKNIARLTKIVVDAVEQFGDTSKSGSKFLKLPTEQINIRKSESIELNEEYVEILTRAINAIIENNTRYKVNTFFDTNLDAAIDSVSIANNKECYPTTADIENTRLNISFDIPVNDLIDGNADEILDLAETYVCKTKLSVDKKSLKEDIKTSSISNFGRIKENKSITIR